MQTEERKPDPKEIVVVQQQSLTEVSDDLIANAERRIADLGKILTLSLRITNHQDWVDQQGKPYLMGSGAEKVARLFGVSWDEPNVEKILSNDEKGSYYFYKVTSTFRMGKDSIGAIGTCSLKDPFFGTQKNAEGRREQKAQSEVDEMDILKKGVTNCIVNGVTRLLGLRNLTWEQVQGAGLKKEAVASVEYKKSTPAPGGDMGTKISAAQHTRLFTILKLGSKTEEERGEREAALKLFIKETYNIDSTADIGWKVYEAICKKAQEIAMDFNEKF